MNYDIFDISAAGMHLEKVRLNISALNLANSNSTRGTNGELFRPLSVTSSAVYSSEFQNALNREFPNQSLPIGVRIDSIEPQSSAPRVVYEPSHPDADEKGFVQYPAVNPVSEMVNLINITRSYEANVRAFNAAKKLMQVAMNIGGN